EPREVVLRGALVAAEQRENSRGIAGAAGVLQDQRVVEIAPLTERELGALGELHTDQTGAERMAHRLALGEIEREGERAEQIRDAHRLRGGESELMPHARIIGFAPGRRERKAAKVGGLRGLAPCTASRAR